ncbi:2-keto-3-deoxy-phosphogluconate aldolase [Murinocardiopsis flavida]|uniref:2-keto-3-deoxy-phosphogluconate aldolase n=1 Tax=Murinocardiopsis flavida TaxID=645275 RepID=A0A2P8DQN9_9ACTN|nr:bifunctional 4-hydroxy-2-oxoglutarate aldolase/2-dehydro-3-deoxy-phosphogluconate aldolase [Murinocardiopsis flavida]PSK99531.1 2-keto-3-deoxy-phosphogluconate aldolase [Murinocardiopsis flavida]
MGFDEIFGTQQVMAILRGMPERETVELATRAWDLGMELVEVPVQTPDAVPSLRAAIAAGAERGRTVGAGTVITVEQVRAVAEAGASFTVAPGFDPAVAAASAAAGMPHLPGVATASEVQQALRHGLTWLKAFPATSLGTAWFAGMAGPFPQVNLVATGGIDAHSAPDYLAAGAKVAAVGSALADPAQIDLLAGLVER